MADIKTRDAVTGTIKAIDKSAVAAERMKDAFIRTKDEAQRGASPTEDSPEKYAADKVTSLAETAASRTAQEFDKQGRKAVQQSARSHTRPFSDRRTSTFIETPPAGNGWGAVQTGRTQAHVAPYSEKQQRDNKTVCTGKADSVNKNRRPGGKTR